MVEVQSFGVAASRNELFSLVCPHVFLEVVFASETLVAVHTYVRPNTCVNQLVSCQLFVSCESFIAIWKIAFKRPFASVNSDVAPKLSVV